MTQASVTSGLHISVHTELLSCPYCPFIAQLMALAQRRPEVAEDPSGALATYRRWLFGQGEEREGMAPDGGSARKGFSREAVLTVLAAKGKVSLPDYLRLRVRYFADGAVLGTREYVDVSAPPSPLVAR